MVSEFLLCCADNVSSITVLCWQALFILWHPSAELSCLCSARPRLPGRRLLYPPSPEAMKSKRCDYWIWRKTSYWWAGGVLTPIWKKSSTCRILVTYLISEINIGLYDNLRFICVAVFHVIIMGRPQNGHHWGTLNSISIDRWTGSRFSFVFYPQCIFSSLLPYFLPVPFLWDLLPSLYVHKSDTYYL